MSSLSAKSECRVTETGKVIEELVAGPADANIEEADKRSISSD
jgi:hypothetical protein